MPPVPGTDAISRGHASLDRCVSVEPSGAANVRDDRPAPPAPPLISMPRSRRFCYRTEHLSLM